MVKKIYPILLSFLFIFSFGACSSPASSNNTVQYQFTRTISREMQSDGWCFSFEYERMKDPKQESPDHIHYLYNGINLRYQYHPDYVEVYTRETEKSTIIEKYASGILLWGRGSEEQLADMTLINTTILLQSRSIDELLGLNPDDYEFKTLNRDLFFRQMHEVLSGAIKPEKETEKQLYADKPEYAMLCEQEYLDGYKFQVAFLIGLGYVNEIYIDVLYETGPDYSDYVQLSDLVEENKANEQQKEVFELIRTVAVKIRGTDNFLINSEEYKNVQIGTVDFSRLYAFLKAIHENQYASYIPLGIVLDTQVIMK